MPEAAAVAISNAAETLLAFDCGQRKIGVALGNTVTRQAQPLTILRLPAPADPATPSAPLAFFAAIETLLQHWQPARLIVGLPLTLDGQEQAASQHSRHFARQLHERFGLPVELVDERGSSMQAQSRLADIKANSQANTRTNALNGTARPGRKMGKKPKAHCWTEDDAMAAAVILERYLDGL